ncbi:MAG TPA: hypothetical protein VGE97_09795 [Nitrososphaera sp.]|jgi:hypothetical protein
MVESPTKRVGKFTIAENPESTASEIDFTKTASKEVSSESAQDSVEPFTLKTRQTTRRKTARTKTAPTVVGQIAEAPADYRLWSQIFIGSANTVVVTWLGAECAMEKREAEMLEPPLARMLSRLPVSTSQKMATFIDPMVMLIALGMWGNRIVRIQRAKRGTGITEAEFARASGMVNPPETNGAETPTQYQPPVEPDIPERVRVPVNPNGIPTAITSQMSEP